MIDFKKILNQTIEQARADKAYTALYMGGVALSIATVLIFAVIYYVRIAAIYPEANRSRTLYLDLVKCVKSDSTSSAMSNLSYRALDEWIYQMQSVEAVSAKMDATITVGANGSTRMHDATVQFVDPAFFKIYDLEFIDGKPFSSADFKSGRKVAVITDRFARKLFGSVDDILGREFGKENNQYTVVGVVRQPSRLTRASFGEAYIPYTSTSSYDNPGWNQDAPYIGGGYGALFLVRDSRQEEALRGEMAEFIRKYNASDDHWHIDILNQPRTHLISVLQRYPGSDFSFADVLRDNLLVLLALLLVPAINISAMIAGRMDSRISEMGIRKAFGARRSRLLSQVMSENLLLTVAGGIIGLVIAWLVLYCCRTWVFDLLLSTNEIVNDTSTITVTGEMIFAPVVFVIALLLCIILNMLSALIPAWRSLRHPIVSSINEKR